MQALSRSIRSCQRSRPKCARKRPAPAQTQHRRHMSKMVEKGPVGQLSGLLNARVPKFPLSRNVEVRDYGYASAADVLQQHPVTEVSTLKNQMRVATEKVDGDTATVGVWIDTGSRFETRANNGVAHFLEHMVFKGTQKRSVVELEKEIENMGGHLNAYTSRESTVFYAKVMKNDVPQAMDILSDILQNSKIEPYAVERERGVILREMEEVDSQTDEVLFDYLHSTAYQRCPLGFTILGPKENIESITSEDINEYVNTHYTGNRMVVCATGNIEHEQIAQLTEQKFGGVPAESSKPVSLQPAVFTGSEIHARFDDMPLAHVAYSFETFGWDEADSFPLMVMQSLMGSWDMSHSAGEHSSSNLIAECAKTKMAQSIMTFNTQYSDTGLFGVYAVAEPTALHDLMHHIQVEVNKLSYDVSERRVEEAKHNLAMNILLQADGCTPLCEDIGRQMLSYGRRLHPLESLARIQQVTVDDVLRIANRYFYDRDFALAAVGPTYELPDYNLLREKTYHLL